MSTSVSSVVSHFPSAENGFTTTTSGSVSSGAATVGLNSVAGYTNGETAVFVIDPSNASKQTFTGVIDTGGVQVTDVVWTAGSNTSHTAGATVVDYATATHISMMTKGILVEHKQTGAHEDVTADSIVVSGTSSLNGALTIKSYDGWINTADTWTYASATTFTIAGVDRTAQFPVGTKIKLTQTTAKYFYVTASSFSTNTTVTVTGGSDYSLANAAITSPALSYDVTPQGFPQWFSYAPTLTNVTEGNGTKAVRFAQSGKTVTVKGAFTYGSTSSASGVVTVSLPITAASGYSANDVIGEATILDSGTNLYTAIARYATTTTMDIAVRVTVSGSNPVFIAIGDGNRMSNSMPMSPATGDKFQWIITYEAA